MITDNAYLQFGQAVNCNHCYSVTEISLMYPLAFRTHYVINFYCPFGPPPILEIGLRHLSHINIGGFFMSSFSLQLTLFSPA